MGLSADASRREDIPAGSRKWTDGAMGGMYGEEDENTTTMVGQRKQGRRRAQVGGGSSYIPGESGQPQEAASLTSTTSNPRDRHALSIIQPLANERCKWTPGPLTLDSDDWSRQSEDSPNDTVPLTMHNTNTCPK